MRFGFLRRWYSPVFRTRNGFVGVQWQFADFIEKQRAVRCVFKYPARFGCVGASAPLACQTASVRPGSAKWAQFQAKKALSRFVVAGGWRQFPCRCRASIRWGKGESAYCAIFAAISPVSDQRDWSIGAVWPNERVIRCARRTLVQFVRVAGLATVDSAASAWRRALSASFWPDSTTMLDFRREPSANRVIRAETLVRAVRVERWQTRSISASSGARRSCLSNCWRECWLVMISNVPPSS